MALSRSVTTPRANAPEDITAPQGDVGGALELRSVTHSFGRVTAVDSVSITVPGREFVTLLGPSGCRVKTHAAADHFRL